MKALLAILLISVMCMADQVFTFDHSLPPTAVEPKGYVSFTDGAMGKAVNVQERNAAYFYLPDIEMPAQDNFTVAFWFKTVDVYSQDYMRYLLLAKQISIQLTADNTSKEYVEIVICEDTTRFSPAELIPRELESELHSTWMPMVWTRQYQGKKQVDSVYFYDRLVFAGQRRGFFIKNTKIDVGYTDPSKSACEFYFDHLCILDKVTGSEELADIHDLYKTDAVHVKHSAKRILTPHTTALRGVNLMGRRGGIQHASTLMIFGTHKRVVWR